jgi:DnaJ-class molecular chaperone
MIMERAMDPKTAICPKCKGKKLMNALLLGKYSLVKCPVCRGEGVVPHAHRDAKREKAYLAELERKANVAQARLF